MRVLAAIPTKDGRLYSDTAGSLLREQMLASEAGIELGIAFVPGSSLVHTARDRCVDEMYRVKADRIVFVDDDVAWEPGALLRIAKHPVDFVGGAYRYKAPAEDYPVAWDQTKATLQADAETGLLEVTALPGGFLSVSKAVFDRIRDANPGRTYNFGGHEFFAYFHCPYGGGEDGAFCTEWRKLGGQVWLDPELRLTHIGGMPRWEGCIGDWLRSRIKEAA